MDARNDCQAHGACDEPMHLLAEHVPISLIMDLGLAAGPSSQEIFAVEGEPESAWWELEPSR